MPWEEGVDMTSGIIYLLHTVFSLLAVIAVFTAVIHEEGEILSSGVRYFAWIGGACTVLMAFSWLVS
jgi:hypothetical protein